MVPVMLIVSVLLCVMVSGVASTASASLSNGIPSIISPRFNDEQTDTHFYNVRRSLMSSTWPADHGDVARSKFTHNAGFTTGFDASVLEHRLQDKIPFTQWLYTGGPNSEFIYAISGRGEFVLSKLDSQTMEILQQMPLERSLYLGGLLIHGNGHVYCVHRNTLYRFWNGDLTNFTRATIPTSLNGNLVQTNGMLATSDGNLIVKQWNMNLEDMFLMKFSAGPKMMKQVVGVVFAVMMGLCVFVGKWSRPRPSRGISAKGGSAVREFSFTGLLFELLLGFLLGSFAFIGIFSLIVYKTVGPYSLPTFLFSNTLHLDGAGGGELKVINPLTFEVVANLQMCERAGYPRMALSPIITETGEEEDAIAFLGDINSYQVRWSIRRQQLYVVPEWTRRYRSRWDGSFPGTGPAIFNNTVYFTDNTFPAFLWGRTFKLFRMPLLMMGDSSCNRTSVVDTSSAAYKRITTLGAGPVDAPPVEGVHLTEKNPGFLFFSVAISPLEGDVLVWDTPSSSLQARRLSDLSLHWEAKVRNMDCVVVAPDKGHVYVTDYDKGSDDANRYLAEITPGEAFVTNVSKMIVVLNASTGQVLANRTVTSNEPTMWVSLIIAGANQDVFFGTSNGLVRVVDTSAKPITTTTTTTQTKAQADTHANKQAETIEQVQISADGEVAAPAEAV